MSPLTPTLQINQSLSEPSFLALLASSGKFKDRSADTHYSTHLPLLSSIDQPITSLLLGDSMLERFQTTGASTPIGMLPFPTLFNAGCGGDCIKHVVFRLGSKDLFSLLRPRKVKFVWLQVGTNDVSRKRGLRDQEIALYALVLEAMKRMAPDATVLVGGIMARKDVNESVVQRSNERLAGLVEEFNALDDAQKKVRYVPPNPEIGLDCLVDHVHLDEGGYTMFSKTMEEALIGAGMEMEG